MSSIGLGLAALGRPEYINIRANSSVDKTEKAFRKNAFSVLDEAYKKGIRFFDTAPSYGKGEQFLVEWNNNRKYSDVVLSTKWGYTYVANWELGYKGSHEVKEHSWNKLIEQWEVSKILLPNLDVYQIHSATFESGVLENKEVLNKLFEIKREFGVKIGLTTSGVKQKEIIERALKIRLDNEDLFDSYQVTYNVFEQDTFEVLKRLKDVNKFVIIKEGLANGRVFLDCEAKLKLIDIANKYKVGIDAVALCFCKDTIMPDVVLSGAFDVVQLNENLKASTFVLEDEDIEVLKKLKTTSEVYWKERSQLSWG